MHVFLFCPCPNFFKSWNAKVAARSLVGLFCFSFIIMLDDGSGIMVRATRWWVSSGKSAFCVSMVGSCQNFSSLFSCMRGRTLARKVRRSCFPDKVLDGTPRVLQAHASASCAISNSSNSSPIISFCSLVRSPSLRYSPIRPPGPERNQASSILVSLHDHILRH